MFVHDARNQVQRLGPQFRMEDPKRGHGGAYVGHGNGGGGRVRLGGLFASRIGEAERAWQLYRLTRIVDNQSEAPKETGPTVRNSRAQRLLAWGGRPLECAHVDTTTV